MLRYVVVCCVVWLCEVMWHVASCCGVLCCFVVCRCVVYSGMVYYGVMGDCVVIYSIVCCGLCVGVLCCYARWCVVQHNATQPTTTHNTT